MLVIIITIKFVSAAIRFYESGRAGGGRTVAATVSDFTRACDNPKRLLLLRPSGREGPAADAAR